MIARIKFTANLYLLMALLSKTEHHDFPLQLLSSQLRFGTLAPLRAESNCWFDLNSAIVKGWCDLLDYRSWLGCLIPTVMVVTQGILVLSRWEETMTWCPWSWSRMFSGLGWPFPSLGSYLLIRSDWNSRAPEFSRESALLRIPCCFWRRRNG